MPTVTVEPPGSTVKNGTTASAQGRPCAGCGATVPWSLPVCPACHPETAPNATLPALGRVQTVSSLGLRSAVGVLRARWGLVLPPAIAVGGTTVVTMRAMARMERGFLLLLEAAILFGMMLLAAAVGFALLTLARAFTVATAIHHFAGADRPWRTALRQVLGRPLSVAGWVILHGTIGVVYGLVPLLGPVGGAASRLRLPGDLSLKNSQYVWQVMFGEDADLGQAMERSAALVRAGLSGSRNFSQLAGGIVVVFALAWHLFGLGDAAISAPAAGWWGAAAVFTFAVSVWAALADIIDTAAWRQAASRQPPLSGPQLLGGGPDLPTADA